SRQRRTAVQYLLVPAAFLLGYLAAVVLPNATDAKGTVPHLVRAAIRNGGLPQPPVPFDPGWRFLAVALVVLVGGAAASLGTGLRRPRLAVLVPVPVVVAAALNQPKGRELASGAVAVVLLVGALMAAFTAEL